MGEIGEMEKDYKQLLSVTSSLFERSQDLSQKTDEQSCQIHMFVLEQAKQEET